MRNGDVRLNNANVSEKERDVSQNNANVSVRNGDVRLNNANVPKGSSRGVLWTFGASEKERDAPQAQRTPLDWHWSTPLRLTTDILTTDN